MDESLRSILVGLTPIYLMLVVAGVLVATRRPSLLHGKDSDRIVHPFLVGVAWQCIHFTEEFATGLNVKLPALLNLTPWSENFLVAFNLAWVAIWILSAVGVRRNVRVAYFPVWFFGVAMLANGLLHPLVSLYVRGYFPGLVTSPVAGLIGVVLVRRLASLTKRKD
ncbi:MAG: HXXEE domain-containing protein [Rhodothermia bacterium]|nr:HXXEE domain-containing protein [Rhodothermia bacterium]